ncbi:hypothetical protein L7F22_043244 [Adiantum nelumboides]|nr:hypothetical protein [Adiantum nelumboides]
MKACKVLEIDDEPAMHQELSSSAHDMYDSYSSASSTCTDDEVYDQSLFYLDVDLCGIHVSTKNDWVSHVVIVPNKGNKWRICVDYKPLNGATKRHHYLLPFQDENLDAVAGHEKYSICDGFSGYFQIKIADEDKKKTSFVTPWGLFCYKVMPFGLMNAYASFQSWMDKLLGPYLGGFVKVFMDEFCVYGDRMIHAQSLDVVFKRIDDNGGQLNPSKCRIARARVVLLGHEINENVIAPDPAKLECLLMMENPKSTKELMSFVQKLRYLSSLLPHALKYPGDNAKLQKWLLNLQQFDMSFIKEDSVRANMADMLTFKEINVKNDMKKDLERKIVPSSTMHEELQEVEGTLYSCILMELSKEV